MTDKKFTDEEIKSSLEVIATTRNCNECKICNCKWGTCNCSQITANAALDLIKRQKAELEAIKDERAMVFKLSEEQLNKVNENLLKSIEFNEREIKAEAYKEFATKIYQAFAIENTRDGYLDCTPNYTRLMECVDNVLKELVGDDK